jgi:tetratricopeptide (TPR) repeat protein
MGHKVGEIKKGGFFEDKMIIYKEDSGEDTEFAKKQLEIQKFALDELKRNNDRSDKNATAIQQLSHSIEEIGENISGSLEDLGDQICYELTQVRSVLHQIYDVGRQSLDLLGNPRNTEAKELTRQGARLLSNNEVDEAETCFLKALKKDPTDHWVLMSIGQIAIRRGRIEEAIDLIQKSIKRPDPSHLEDKDKIRALWLMSQLHYNLKSFNESYLLGMRVIGMTNSASKIYRTGVYGILAGKIEEGMRLIQRAIIQDPKLFGLAMIDPDLKIVEREVFMFLARLYADAYREFSALWRYVGTGIKEVGRIEVPHLCWDNINDLVSLYEQVGKLVRVPLYSNLTKSIIALDKIIGSESDFDRIASLDIAKADIEKELLYTQEHLEMQEKEYGEWKKVSDQFVIKPPKVSTSFLVILFIIITIFFSIARMTTGVIANIFFWIIFFLIIHSVVARFVRAWAIRKEKKLREQLEYMDKEKLDTFDEVEELKDNISDKEREIERTKEDITGALSHARIALR